MAYAASQKLNFVLFPVEISESSFMILFGRFLGRSTFVLPCGITNNGDTFDIYGILIFFFHLHIIGPASFHLVIL